MGNCNTLTCQLDGRITPMETTLDGRAAADGGACTDRGRSRSGRRTARPDAAQVERQPVPGTVRADIEPKREPPPPPAGVRVERQPVPGDIVPKREPPPPPAQINLTDKPQGGTILVGGGGADLARVGPKPTDLGGGSADAAQTSAFGPLTHVAGTSPGPSKGGVGAEGNGIMVLGEAQFASPVKSAGAISPQDCYRRFLSLPPGEQARILVTGALGRYQLTQSAARDVLNGVFASAAVAASWIFNTFAPQSVEVATFCNGVATFSPAGFVSMPGSRVVAPMAQQGMDGWTRAAALSHMQTYRQYFPGPMGNYAPAGAVFLLDGASAQQVFSVLSRDRQAAILRGLAFAGLAYPAALAAAIERGDNFIDGVPVPDLLAAYMERFPEGSPRKVLFGLAVQNANTTAPAGRAFRSAGNVSTAPTSGTGGGGSGRSGVAPGAPGANLPSTSGANPPSTSGAAPSAPPAAFLQQAGLNAQQWANLASQSPEVAVQLWREFNNRPNTFAQVATTVLQGVNAVLTGVHQQNVDDLAAASAQYAHQQAMATIAAQREQSEAQRALAASQATQPVVSYQQQVQPPPPPPPPPPPSEGLTAKHYVAGGAVLAVLAGGAYYLTRKKKNRRPRRRRALKAGA